MKIKLNQTQEHAKDALKLLEEGNIKNISDLEKILNETEIRIENRAIRIKKLMGRKNNKTSKYIITYSNDGINGTIEVIIDLRKYNATLVAVAPMIIYGYQCFFSDLYENKAQKRTIQTIDLDIIKKELKKLTRIIN